MRMHYMYHARVRFYMVFTNGISQHDTIFIMMRFLFIFLAVFCMSIEPAYAHSLPGLFAMSFYSRSFIAWVCVYIWLIRRLFGLKTDPPPFHYILKNLLAFLIAIICAYAITLTFFTSPNPFLFIFGIFVAYGFIMAVLNRDTVNFPFFFVQALIYTGKALLVLVLLIIVLCTGIVFVLAFLSLETTFFIFPMLPWIALGLGPFFLIAILDRKQSNKETFEQISETISIAALCVTLITVPFIMETVFRVFFY